VHELSPLTLKSWLDNGSSVQLLDARSGVEFNTGTIAGARHAPVTGLPGLLDEIELDPDRPVVVLCASGHRSRPWARLLAARGLEVYSLKGGLHAWRSAGYELTKSE
jgi:rhodanese-related sulfurtransferase